MSIYRTIGPLVFLPDNIDYIYISEYLSEFLVEFITSLSAYWLFIFSGHFFFGINRQIYITFN